MLEKGDESSWNVMLDRYSDEQNAQEKRKLLSGLGKDELKNIVKLFKACYYIYIYIIMRML